MHLFSDASEKAYACSIYLRSQDNNHIEYNLLCAKSRVAPVNSITLPRLELCSALLAARLANKYIESLDLNIDRIFMCTDSTIVLSWISGQPRMWKTFVSNRVAEIQNLTEIQSWNYILSSS